MGKKNNNGDCNNGDRNVGDCNNGYRNVGNWNVGYLNTDEPKVRIFNKETDILRCDIEFPLFFFFKVVEFIPKSEMTMEEKTAENGWEITGGYLKTHDYKDAFKKSWDNANKKDREKLFALPNFDADIFYEISGIDVRKVNEPTINISGADYLVSDIEAALSAIKPVR